MLMVNILTNKPTRHNKRSNVRYNALSDDSQALLTKIRSIFGKDAVVSSYACEFVVAIAFLFDA